MYRLIMALRKMLQIIKYHEITLICLIILNWKFSEKVKYLFSVRAQKFLLHVIMKLYSLSNVYRS